MISIAGMKTDKCETCKGSGKKMLRHETPTGFRKTGEVVSCRPCFGTGRIPRGALIGAVDDEDDTPEL